MAVDVLFDSPSDRGGKGYIEGLCNITWSNKAISLIGADSLCTWENDAHMVIYLASSAVIQVGDIITLRIDSLRAQVSSITFFF